MFRKATGGGTKKRNTALPMACRVCSTCALWAGAREIQSSGVIAMHPYSKGECCGGRYKHLQMGALATCDTWQLLSAMDDYQGGQQAKGAS